MNNALETQNVDAFVLFFFLFFQRDGNALKQISQVPFKLNAKC